MFISDPVSARPSGISATWLLALLAAALCVAVAVLSYRYTLRIGPTPDIIAANRFALPWLILHATAAATALLAGPLQFWPGLRARNPALHRWNGRVYVAGCILGGLSGLVLASGAASGPVATAGFGLLALAWLAATILALRAAMTRRFAQHRAWMIRSFTLTFSAVTLRLYLPVLLLLPVDFETGYRAISFLCWVPNLIAAEIYLRRH